MVFALVALLAPSARATPSALAAGGAWSGIKPVPGPLSASAPTVAEYGGALHLFFRGTNNTIFHGVLDNRPGTEQWTVPTNVPGGGLTLSAPAATTTGDPSTNIGVGPNSSRLHLFVRGTDDHIYVNRYDGTSWTGWFTVPGGMLTSSAPAAATHDGRVYVLVRGTDNRIYYNRYDPATNLWLGWQEVLAGNGALTSSTPSVVDSGNHLRVFIRGTDDRVYESVYETSSWTEVSGDGRTLDAPAAVIEDDVHLFVRGLDNQVYENLGTLDPNVWGGGPAVWSGWQPVTASAVTGSAPAVAIYAHIAPQRFHTSTFDLYLFSRASNGYLSYVSKSL